jgi:Activator of Hsp90 ATPase homolog 1-like protein
MRASGSARLEAFEPRAGGTYRMILTDHLADAVAPGEASADTGVVCGRFSAPIPDRRIVQQIEFESGDPAFAGTMTMIWSLAATPEGTEVTIRCEDVPEGIRKGTMTRV